MPNRPKTATQVIAQLTQAHTSPTRYQLARDLPMLIEQSNQPNAMMTDLILVELYYRVLLRRIHPHILRELYKQPDEFLSGLRRYKDVTIDPAYQASLSLTDTSTTDGPINLPNTCLWYIRPERLIFMPSLPKQRLVQLARLIGRPVIKSSLSIRQAQSIYVLTGLIIAPIHIRKGQYIRRPDPSRPSDLIDENGRATTTTTVPFLVDHGDTASTANERNLQLVRLMPIIPTIRKVRLDLTYLPTITSRSRKPVDLVTHMRILALLDRNEIEEVQHILRPMARQKRPSAKQRKIEKYHAWLELNHTEFYARMRRITSSYKN